MKTIYLLLVLSLFSFSLFAQDKALHGKVFGNKPGAVIVNADKLESYIAARSRMQTTIRGKVLNVVKEKGGWFTIDAGNGKTIAAHFAKYDVTIPADLKGKTVVVEGIAQRQAALTDQQHLAGKKQASDKTTDKLSMEVTGLMVE
ncbi:MAG: DUF4920 domain-containing protein [Bacteroidetes bacterium]|jgi:hypothetical protein|nr:DUF4920 domain-containing protein [Bacteroidota bacterium]